MVFKLMEMAQNTALKQIEVHKNLKGHWVSVARVQGSDRASITSGEHHIWAASHLAASHLCSPYVKSQVPISSWVWAAFNTSSERLQLMPLARQRFCDLPTEDDARSSITLTSFHLPFCLYWPFFVLKEWCLQMHNC